MAFDLGIYSELYVCEESVYGTAPDGSGGGVYHKLNFVPTHGLSKQQNLLPSDVLGQGRDPADPTLGAINVQGPIAVPLCNNQIGVWLRHMLGAPTTTGATNYTHSFESNKQTIPSFATQIWMPKLGKSRMAVGCFINEMVIEMGREVLPTARMTVIAQNETDDTAVEDASPLTDLVLSRFHAFTGSIKKDTVAMADIISATFTYRNNLDVVAPIRSDGLITEVLPGPANFEMSLRARVKDGTLLDVAGTSTPIEVEFGYTTGANNSLLFTAHRVFLPNPSKEISGPGGIEVTFTGMGAKDTSPARMLTAELKNQVATY